MKRKVLTIVWIVTLTALVFTGTVWANVADPDTRSQVAGSDNSGAVILYALPSAAEIRVTALRPVQIPGAVLQPGQYSFRLTDSGSVVAVSNIDRSEFYGNYLIVPASRNHRDDTVAYTAAAPEGGPDRITALFRPGSLWGYAFLYPKAKQGNVQVAAK
ncbi:MAG TPA: hypothetical protein VMS96_13175 [Terriglobales bacterium]|nr:hypothetical protein [Terriglobales bacterium]